MMRRILATLLFIFFANSVVAQTPPLPGFPLDTQSGVWASCQCTKSSDETYAVCGSMSGSGIAVKYNLQPFSIAAEGPNQVILSCDLYQSSSESASRVVCAQPSSSVICLQVSNMTQTALILVPTAANYVVVDSPNQVAYVSNNNVPASIVKINSIGSLLPTVVGSVTWGQNNGDQYPCALLIVDDFLYAHLNMNPSRLARFRISNFSHDQTIQFDVGESAGFYDNLANDNNFIYDLTQSGILVRCTYQNNNFSRFDSLSTSFTVTWSLSISPDLQTLFFTAYEQNVVVLVDVTTFSQTLSTEPVVPYPFGRPIVMSNGDFYVFAQNNDLVYGFKYCPVNATYGGSSKIPCPAGYFCPDPNAPSPTPCGPGNFTPSEGWCYVQTCPAGSFCPSNTTISPQDCPAGAYCPQGSSLPILCPAGSYCPSGNSAPLPCGCGNYCPENTSSPIICPIGTYTLDLASACAICPANFYCPSQGTCTPIPCPFGSVCPPGSIIWQSTLVSLPSSPFETNSGVSASIQCTKSSDEVYAVCGTDSVTPFESDVSSVKYNLQPFSFALTGPTTRNWNGQSRLSSCDLYQTALQSTSRVVCALQIPATSVIFLRASDMTQTSEIPVTTVYFVGVDTPSQVAYVSNNNIPATIVKINSIGSLLPTVVGSVTWGQNNGDQYPCALLTVGDFVYVNLDMNPSRLARFRISNFSHDQTIQFDVGESLGFYDNLANDKNFIYDLTLNGIIVRCTYQDNNFSRFDSLITGFSYTFSLSISPDLKTLFCTSYIPTAVFLVNVTAFNQTLVTPSIVGAFGRPIVMSNGNFYVFSRNNDKVWGFSFCPVNATYGGSSKILCPAGYFCPDPNAPSPTPCGPGKFTPSEGRCYAQTCPAGFFCPSNNTISPRNCTAAGYCPQGSIFPIPCPVGSYCPPGAAAPVACYGGNYCPANSTSPTICPGGTYAPDATLPCAMCPANFYCPEASSYAFPCPVGLICPPGSAAWLSSLNLFSPNSPINTSSGVTGSSQCTKNSDETYAVCGAQKIFITSGPQTTAAVKYNLQPFSVAAEGPTITLTNYNFLSCDLYEEAPTQQSTSRVVCALFNIVYFYQVSEMTAITSVALINAYYVTVDAKNQVAYVSNNNNPPVIFKIINIASSSPSAGGNVTWGGDNTPNALLIVGDFLYVHCVMDPARIARIRISNFSHDKTVEFLSGERFGEFDNLANDNNFIYDLTRRGILVRCTYQNNNFSRFDNLSTDFTSTFSLSISPDLQTLFFTTDGYNAVVLVHVATFSQFAVTAPIIPGAVGRPIVMSSGIFYAFSGNNDLVYGFTNCYQRTNATYGDDSSKRLCPAGYFCPDPNATSPTPCGPGKYTPSEGWCWWSICQQGSFCPSNTTVNPEACPEGFFCPTPTSSIPCPCGSFCPSGSVRPSPCNAGTFNPNNGSSSNTSCEACPLAKSCLENSCSPASCSCGMYCSAASRTNCTPGYYNSDPSYFCSLCPEGFYCPLQRTCSPIRCDENQFCPPGSSEPLRTVLVPIPNSPFETSSGVLGSVQCTKNSDESYAVCGSNSGAAIKYNLQPFAAESRKRNQVSQFISCDLFATELQSTSRAVCAQQQSPATLLFLQVSDMTQTATVLVPHSLYVVVDTPNQVAYVSSNDGANPVIFKIINIASSSPSVVGNVTWGQNNGDQYPCALLIVDDFLYAHLNMNPSRLARIRISDFSSDQTVAFEYGEYGGYYDNVANDNNFIYDLTQNGIIVRCTYQNNNFARFDSLSTVFGSAYSLSVSPDLKTLFFTSQDQSAIVLVDVTTFSRVVATAPIIPSAFGRPIVMSSGFFYAFSQSNDLVYGFQYCKSLNNTYGGASKHRCPAGHFCPDPNATSPTPCSPGTYAVQEGFCVCLFCPSGTFCPSASTIIPHICPVGTYNPIEGASSIADCLSCPLGRICQEGTAVPINCNQQNCYSTRNCSLYRSLLVGVTDAQPYCVVSNRTSCTSPLTCSSINLPAYDIPLQCEAAGCSYSGSSCVNRNDCFNLFLPSYVIQPLGLMFIGFAKDLVCLLLIGIFGDVLMRRVKATMLPFNFWKNKWNKEKIKPAMETTIFANDAKCRNETTATNRESFEEYCERISDALFELPEMEDEEIRKDWKRRLVDAITFSMFDSGLWFELEENAAENSTNVEQEIVQQNNEIDAQERSETKEPREELSKPKFSPKNDETPTAEEGNDQEDEVEKDESNGVVHDQNQSEDQEPVQPQKEENNKDEQSQDQNNQIITSKNVNCDEEISLERKESSSFEISRKHILTSESFATTSTLQQFVNAHITSHAQCVVYFASSRDWKLRAASAMNSFPSPLQLFYYIVSVLVFVAVTFRDVVFDSSNQNIIDQVSNYTCGIAQKHSADKTTYLLLGFRLLNSSTTATVILIFIKTLHAIYSSSSERFKNLQLPQRLPILGLLTSKSTQILLVFYFLVVASFALAGVTYGIHIIPSLMVVIVAAFLLLLDAAVLKLVRAFISKRRAMQDAERDKILAQVATHDLPLLGLNSDSECENTRESLLSQSQRSLSTINDEDQQQRNRGAFDVITADEAFDAAKQSVLNPAPTSLPQALLVFLLKEEIPTIILTITLQLCFNYMCLFEFGEAFGVADQWQLPKTEYEARKFDCIWGMFESDVSGIMSVLSSFVGFV